MVLGLAIQVHMVDKKEAAHSAAMWLQFDRGL